MPTPTRTHIVTALIGFALASVFVAMLLWFDIAGLRISAQTSSAGVATLIGLWVINGIIFAALQAMLASSRNDDEDDDDHRGGGHREDCGRVQLIPVRVRRDDRR